MPVERFEVTNRVPFAGGKSFDGLTYQRLDGIVSYVVDPDDPANAEIVDLKLAARDSDGLVHFSGDGTLLVPVNGRGNEAALLDVPNRGHRVAPRMFQASPIGPDWQIDPGDGLLLRQGWTLAFCGWQWDVPRVDGRMGLDVPMADREVTGEMQLRFQVGADVADLRLTDQHVGPLGGHSPIVPDPQRAPLARLYVRETPYGEATLIAREKWQFRSGAGPEMTHIALDERFSAGRVYDLVYKPVESPVAGAGLLALRDFAVFLKQGDASFQAAKHVIGEGVSQCGRCLRTFLHHGLNLDEQGRQAFDGLLIHVAGGRRGQFNHRYAQPSVQPTPGFGHLPPFADQLVDGPGLLDRQRAAGGVPRIFYTDTSAEYWRGDASLAHTHPQTGEDVDPPAGTRRYLWSSTQHGAGLLPPVDESPFCRAENLLNVIDYRPLMRAALVNLRAWVVDDVEPPQNAFPRKNDGSGVSRESVLETLSDQSLSLPDPALLNKLYPLDLGSDADMGVGDFPARICGAAYPSLVSALDASGNEVAGVQMPDVAVPVGLHTGFNPRHHSAGGTGQVVDYTGTTAFFSPEDLTRRYGPRESYLARIAAFAGDLVKRRYLLAEDVERCVALAADRYDTAMRLNETR